MLNVLIGSVVGSIIGIVGTYFINKKLGWYRREEKIVWYESPFIEFTNANEVSASWIFENLGNKIAEDIKIVIGLPHKANFEKFSVISSEPAIDITVKEEELKLIAYADRLPINATISIAALISNLNKKEQVKISVLSKNGQAVKFKDYTQKFTKKIEKKINTIVISFFTFIVLAIIGASTLIILNFLDTINELQTEHIVRLYLKDQNYDGGIEAYKDFLRATFFYDNEGVIYYRLAKLYALRNDYKNSIANLQLAIKKKSYLRKVALSDSFWEKYKNEDIFRVFFQKLQNVKS